MTIEDKIAAWPPKPPIRVQYKSDKEPYRSNALLDIVMQQRDRAIAERDLALEVLRRLRNVRFSEDVAEVEAAYEDASAFLAACGKGEV